MRPGSRRRLRQGRQDQDAGGACVRRLPGGRRLAAAPQAANGIGGGYMSKFADAPQPKFANEPKFADAPEPSLADFTPSSIAWVIQRFIDKMGSGRTKQLGASQSYTLKCIQRMSIGKRQKDELTKHDL